LWIFSDAFRSVLVRRQIIHAASATASTIAAPLGATGHREYAIPRAAADTEPMVLQMVAQIAPPRSGAGTYRYQRSRPTPAAGLRARGKPQARQEPATP